MGTHRERFLNICATITALLTGSASIELHYFTPGTFSLECEYEKKRYPTSIIDTFCEIAMHHPTDRQIFNNYQTVAICVVLGGFEVEVAALALNFEMRLSYILGRLRLPFLRRLNTRCLRRSAFCALR